MSTDRVKIDISLTEQSLKGFDELNRKLDKAEKATNEVKNASIALQRAREKGMRFTQKYQNRLERALINEKKALGDVNLQLKRNKELHRQIKQAIDAETASQKKNNAQRKKSIGLLGTLRKNWFIFTGVLLAAGAALKQLNKIKDTLVTLDAFRFAMTKITKSSAEAADAWNFVSAMADKYGISLAKTADRYVKFSTAARQAGLSITDTQSIYDSMSKASGVLGLKTQEVEGVFLALEQMLSKGKITTEELRRQLGERLPGAFGMMVKAYNRLHPEQEVTLQQFDALLKKGKVLSGEVLPEFAKVVEEELGIQTVESVNTLQAAIVRADNAFVKMVEDMERGTGMMAKITIGFYKILKEAYTEIGELFLTMTEQEDKYFARGFSQRRVFLEDQRAKRPIGEGAGDFKDAESRDEAIRKYLADQYILYSKELERLRELWENYPVAGEIVEEIMSFGVGITRKDDLEMQINDIAERVGRFKGALLELNELELDNLLPPKEEDKKKKKFVPYYDPESIKGIEMAIKYMEELKDTLNPDDWGEIDKELDILNEQLLKLTDPDKWAELQTGIDAQSRAEGESVLPEIPLINAIPVLLEQLGVDIDEFTKDFPLDAVLKEWLETSTDEDSIFKLNKFLKKSTSF
jgi:tape measure domain-containing protein